MRIFDCPAIAPYLLGPTRFSHCAFAKSCCSEGENTSITGPLSSLSSAGSGGDGQQSSFSSAHSDKCDPGEVVGIAVLEGRVVKEKEEGTAQLMHGAAINQAEDESRLSLSRLLEEQLVDIERVYAALSGDTAGGADSVSCGSAGLTNSSSTPLQSSDESPMRISPMGDSRDSTGNGSRNGPTSDQSLEGMLSAQHTPSALPSHPWLDGSFAKETERQLTTLEDAEEVQTEDYESVTESVILGAECPTPTRDCRGPHVAEAEQDLLEEFLDSIRQSLLQSEARLSALYQPRGKLGGQAELEHVSSSGRCQSLQVLSTSERTDDGWETEIGRRRYLRYGEAEWPGVEKWGGGTVRAHSNGFMFAQSTSQPYLPCLRGRGVTGVTGEAQEAAGGGCPKMLHAREECRGAHRLSSRSARGMPKQEAQSLDFDSYLVPASSDHFTAQKHANDSHRTASSFEAGSVAHGGYDSRHCPGGRLRSAPIECVL